VKQTALPGVPTLTVPPEHRFQTVGRDPHAGIRYGEADVVPDALDADEDAAGARGERDGVAQQVGEHLEGPRRIERRQRGRRDDLRLERDAAGGRLRLKRFDRFRDDMRGVGHLARHRQHPAALSCNAQPRSADRRTVGS
jgi:hypothetical protein